MILDCKEHKDLLLMLIKPDFNMQVQIKDMEKTGKDLMELIKAIKNAKIKGDKNATEPT